MPRTVQDILDHADELAKRFEDYEPSPTDERDPKVFAELRRAVLSRSDAERAIKDAVDHGYSWAFIGSLVGTSGEATRQRYGHKQDAWLEAGLIRSGLVDRPGMSRPKRIRLREDVLSTRWNGADAASGHQRPTPQANREGVLGAC